MTFDQAQSPRLGQKVAPEGVTVQLRSVNTLPEVAPKGMMVYLGDRDQVAVYNGDAWLISGGTATQNFVGPNQPVADNIGDSWFNTTDSTIHVWDGTTWARVVDPEVDQVRQEASDNLAAAVASLNTQLDEKITTFYDTVQPTTGVEGDLWIHTTTNRLYRYNGTNWTEIQDKAIADAINAAGDAQSTADGKIDSYFQTAAPTGLGQADDGDLWFDTDDNNKVYRWSGSQWVLAADARIATQAGQISSITTQLSSLETQVDGKVTTWFQATAPWPNTPTADSNVAGEGDIWFNSTDKLAYRWDKRNWVKIEDPRVGTTLTKVNEVESLANGKISHYVGTAFPWANAAAGDTSHDQDFGDVVTRTDLGNARYYWADNRTWTILPVGNSALGSDISGSKITTGTINANLVNVTNLSASNITSGSMSASYIYGITISASQITAGTISSDRIATSSLAAVTISADKITTGTLNCANLTVTNLSASSITSGNFSGDRITGGTIKGASFWTITGTSWNTNGVEINSSGVKIYNSSGLVQVSMGTDGYFSCGQMVGNGSYNLDYDGSTRSNYLHGNVFVTSLKDGGSGNSAFGPKYVRASDTGRLYASTTAPSSRELKHDIADLNIDPQQVLSLIPKVYRYNDESRGTLRAGFIAEEAHDLGLTTWVGYEHHDDPTKPTGFDYDGYVAALQVVARYQQTRIDALEARIAALEAPAN